MPNLNLRYKILLSYMLLLFILVTISYFAVKHLIRLGTLSKQVIEENYRSIDSAQSMLKCLERHQSGEWMLIAGKKEEADKILAENKEEFLRWLDVAKLHAVLEGESDLVTKIEELYINYLTLYGWIEKYVELKDFKKVEFYSNRSRLQQDKLRSYCLHLLEMNRKSMFQASENTQQVSLQYITSMIVSSFIAVVFGILLSFWLTNLIVTPVEDLTRAVSEIRKGNLDITVNTDTSGEIGILSVEFNKMTERLKAYQKLNLEKIIEEKKRTEAIIRSVGDCMIVIDPNYKIITVNPAAEKIFYLLPGISHGKDIRQIIKNKGLHEIIKANMDNAGFSHNSSSLPTITLEHEREKKHYQVKISSVSREDGTKLGYVILLEDVTKLKELDQMKSDFLSIASHELRTPLTSIIMSIGMILDGFMGDINPDQVEVLKTANEDARRMQALLNNLLDISRIETGRLEMEFTPVSPSSLLKDICKSFDLPTREKKIQLITEVSGDIPPVRADYGKIMQVFSNLIGNAVRYTPEGGSITLTARRSDEFVRFSVSDTGPGIPEDYRNKIFQKFIQIPQDTRRGGAGLGLALSREIINAHGGKIWLDEKEEGTGALLVFTLPIVEEFH